MSCNTFCKDDYVPTLYKKFQQVNPRARPTRFSYQVCRKTFCNPTCKGYHKTPRRFSKYTRSERKRLQARGALSGCVKVADFDI